jgi:hypothetical protein
MSIKVHNNALYVLIASILAVQAVAAPLTLWSNSQVGRCEFLDKQSKDASINTDEDKSASIVRTELAQGKHGEKYTWYWDNTPSRNLARTLTRQGRNGMSCVILFLPIADQHDFKIDIKGNLPSIVKSTTSPLTNSDGTTEVIELSYRLNRTTVFYSKNPSNCKKIIDKKALKINCKTL